MLNFLFCQENERLDNENEKAAEKLIDCEKTISKQQRDLEGFQELEDRVSNQMCLYFYKLHVFVSYAGDMRNLCIQITVCAHVCVCFAIRSSTQTW